MSTTTDALMKPATFTLDHYEHMVDVGAFDGEFRKRVELIRGEIVMMSPIGDDHSNALIRLTDWSYQHVDLNDVEIRVQTSLRLAALGSEPEPDLVWADRARPAGRPGPEHVRLVVEVAGSSLQFDRHTKVEFYAAAGIAEYWIVNLIDEQIEVYRQPSGKSYQDRSIHRGTEALSPLALPSATLEP